MKATEQIIEGARVSRQSRIRELESRAASLAAEIQALKVRPKEPLSTFDGPPAVVIFTKTFGSRLASYTYAAISTGGRWWITGKTTRSFSWDELLDFVDGATGTMLEAGSWVSLRRETSS